MKFTLHEVKITLLEPLLGTIPKNPDVYATYIAGKKDSKGELLIPSETMIAEEVATVPDIEKSGWTGFHTDEAGCFMYNYALLGFLKEAGNTLKDQLGIKALKSKIDQFVFVEPRRIRLKAAPDGVLERSLRAMTMQGPRVTLVRSDYIDAGTELVAQIRVLKNKEVTGDTLREILEYGRYRGLGQFRNGSYGQFSFTMVDVD
ncbi:MAG: hypothetical protein DDT34_02235 [Firmicutes bacterium]|nr:hypothetical protein [Bacillota bacterium]